MPEEKEKYVWLTPEDREFILDAMREAFERTCEPIIKRILKETEADQGSYEHK